MAAEFIVIVVGVLVALGVDSFVSWTQDRALESEYLERLLQDVDLASVGARNRATVIDELRAAGGDL